MTQSIATPEVMKKYFIGSVLSGGGSVPALKATHGSWVNMANEIQKTSLSTGLGTPMIYGIDAVHGHNNVYGVTIFPHNVGLAFTRWNMSRQRETCWLMLQNDIQEVV